MGSSFFPWVRADSDVIQQYDNCWKLCFLLGPPEAILFDLARRVDSCELEQNGVGVRWSPACEDVSPGSEECSILQDVTQQRSEDHNWEH
jgi:hypothetical protein